MSQIMRDWIIAKEGLTSPGEKAHEASTREDNRVVADLQAKIAKRESLRERAWIQEALKARMGPEFALVPGSWWDEAVDKFEDEYGEKIDPGDLTDDDISSFQKILIPMIRRVIPTMIANEIVGVQPMTAPTGKIFSMRATYAKDYDGDTDELS